MALVPRHKEVDGNLLAIQLKAASRNGNITRRIVSFHQIQSGSDPELEDDCQTKGRKHAGHDESSRQGGFDFIQAPQNILRIPLNRENNIVPIA